MADPLYKILECHEWTTDAATVPWATVDRRDGFVHLSSAAQVRETARRHFRECPQVCLLEIDVHALPGETLKWEISRGGALFPHVYGDIPRAAVVATWRLSRQDDGELEFPTHL